MSQQQLLSHVLDKLEGIGIAYMLTGSWASSLQGQPRSTHDLDIVVNLDETTAPKLLAAFPAPDYYLSKSSIAEAIRNRSMFNLLDNQSGDKVDFWMLTDEPWDRVRFSRRVSIKILGRDVAVSSPEDTVLAKLRWSKLSGGSERQLNDARQVCEVQWEFLDLDYLRQWSRTLGVDEAWHRIATSHSDCS